MKLHDYLSASNTTDAVRVPGGWIYTTYHESGSGGCNMCSCFVPYSTEFKMSEAIGGSE